MLRRIIPAALAMVALQALPAVAQPSEQPQRVELPDIGLVAAFPTEWTVRTPMTPRESWFDVSADDATPVYVWTGVFATGGGGRWCGIDRFEDFPWPFDEHAAFLERWHVSGHLYGVSGGYESVDLPSGRAYRIDVDDELKERSLTLYLLQHGSDRILLTCADELGSPEDWQTIAASIELGPRTADAPAAMAATLDAIHAD
jgi:hypothetical protein